MRSKDGAWTHRDTQRLKVQRKARAWTTAQVAELLKVSPSHVRRLIQTGVLRGFLMDGKWYVEPETLTAYLEAHS